ncbi:MAG TPA: hypothetical protein VMP08_05885 [Anaerolineae bacterium]|nr:hypothetical protein [Anaerolineae bacterium]
MTIQHIPLTQANRRMKQIRQFIDQDGCIVLTSHDKPALIVVDVEHCCRLLCSAEQLVQILAASNLVEAAKAISTADTSGLRSDRDWLKRTLEELKSAANGQSKIRGFERTPRE